MVYIKKTSIIRSQDGLQKDTSVAFVFHPFKLLFLCPEAKRIQFFMTVFRRRLGFEPMTNNTFEICQISLISALQQQRLGCVTIILLVVTFCRHRRPFLDPQDPDTGIYLGGCTHSPRPNTSLSPSSRFTVPLYALPSS